MTGQGLVVWLTGRPAAGKSTLAAAIVNRLRCSGLDVHWLDSDEVRARLAPKLGFNTRDRDQFYDLLAKVVADAADHHDVVVVSATAPLARHRQAARRLVHRFVEVLVTASDATLRARDPKGLYAGARHGLIANVPGADSTYETPSAPDMVCDTDATSTEVLATQLSALTRERAGLSA